MDFEIIDISGDVGLRVVGKDMEELFATAAKGLYNLITDTNYVRPERSVTVEVKAHDMEGLLVRFLNELIYQFDTYGFVGSSLKVDLPFKGAVNLQDLKGEFWIKAELSGEEFDPERHERRLLVKAATYHNLKIYKKEGLWQTEIIFDI